MNANKAMPPRKQKREKAGGGKEERHDRNCPATFISLALQNAADHGPLNLYGYSPLPKPGSIRLLRLMPAEKHFGIKCELFVYPLQDTGEKECLYEALSYVWGGSDKPKSISIGDYQLAVTPNLYTALLHLRDQWIERILWVDAICINQSDKEEQGLQVRSMAEIYCKASRVIVWLGEMGAESDQALKEIRVAAEEGHGDSLHNGSQRKFLALLERDWFKRVWVLQEVAAARHVLLMCCSTTIDGYAFCLGLQSLKLSYNALQDLRSIIRSVTYLIKGSIFRPKYTTTPSGMISLGIRPLGELIDMYHTRAATDPRDKVFALLGMSSNDHSTALSPNYKNSMELLMYQLVKAILGKEVYIKTWPGTEMAFIRAKGCILGKVSSTGGSDLDDTQQVFIKSKDSSGQIGPPSKWTLQASENSVQVGDLVCFLQGASQPTIIRPCKDHFLVIMITVRPPPTESESIGQFPHNFMLVWDWAKLQGNLQDREYKTFMEKRVHDHLNRGNGHLRGRSDESSRLYNAALILEDAEEYEISKTRYQEARECHASNSGNEDLRTITITERLAVTYQKTGQLKEAETILKQIAKTRMRIQGVGHPDTISTMVKVASVHKDQGNLEEEGHWKAMIGIFERKGDESQKEMARVVMSSDIVRVQFLLEWDAIQITEGVLSAAAGSKYSRDILSLLLKSLKQEEKGGEITGDVLSAAAGNEKHGLATVTMLLELLEQDSKVHKFPITEGVLRAAMGNDNNAHELLLLLLNSLDEKGKEDCISAGVFLDAAGKTYKIVTLLVESLESLESLDQKAIEDRITEDVLRAAAGNTLSGKVVELFLEWLDQKAKGDRITEDVLRVALENTHSERPLKVLLWSLDQKRTYDRVTEGLLELAARSSNAARHNIKDNRLKLLLESLDESGKEVKITKSLLLTAVKNGRNATDATTCLFNSLDEKRNNLQVTEDILIAAIRNESYRRLTFYGFEDLLTILLNWRSNEAQVTEGVLLAAVAEHDIMDGALKLLLDRKGKEVPITKSMLVIAITRHHAYTDRMLKLLLDSGGSQLQITEEIITAVVTAAEAVSRSNPIWGHGYNQRQDRARECLLAHKQKYGV